MRKFLYILFLGSIFASGLHAQNQPNDFNCFTIIAGKDATTTGDILAAHNEDDYGDYVVNFYKVPKRKFSDSDVATFKNGAQDPQPEETQAYLWINMPGLDFSDSYFNESGLCIFSNACSSREDRGELTDGGIGYWLRRLMAERAGNAREAVKIGGALIEKYGYYSSGRSYSIAGPKEAWLLSAVNGKHWVAQRIPADKIMILPNYYIIHEVNLSDTMNFYGSDDIITYAQERGWYNPETDGPFDFAKAYSDQENLIHPNNITRQWGALHLLAKKDFKAGDEIPFAVEPKEKISPEMLMKVLAYHHEGTEKDLTENYEKGDPHNHGEYTICTSHTQYGIVAELRQDLPAEMATRIWIAPFRPCVNPFLPWYPGLQEIPAAYTQNDNDWANALQHHFDETADYREKYPESVHWQFVDFAASIDDDYKNKINDVREAKSKKQKAIQKRTDKAEKTAVKTAKNNPEKLAKSLYEITNRELTNESANK